MEIIHLAVQKELVFAIAAFPESIAISHKDKRIAVIEDSIGRTRIAARSMVADFDRNFKNVVR